MTKVFASAGAAQVQAQLDALIGSVEAHKTSTCARVDSLEATLKELNAKLALASLGGSDSPPAHFGGDVLAGVSADERQRFVNCFRAMSTDSNPDGGYLVDRKIEQAIGRLAASATTFRGLARVVSIDGGDRFVKHHWQGRSEAKWVAERQPRTQTATPQLSETEIVVSELQAMPAATQRVIDDSRADLASELAQDIALAFAEAENAAFISGNGVNKPRGLLTYDTLADTSWTWGKLGFVKTGDGSGFVATSSTVSPADCLIDLVYRLKPSYRANARWLLNSNTAAVIRKWKDSEGRYIWTDSIIPGQPATLLGYPVVVDDAMPDVSGGAFPIAFGDFNRGYLIVDRIGIRVLRDPYSQKPYVLFYTTKRVGGGVMDFQAIKLIKVAS